ncbi:flagellar export protein FliJ [Jeotgalibacillus haloalkalitolerans]|uniref:Flagellar FliJ protein n=1 Tax=Jeotgalibacillus haloalkalitolerans TaxID=3104292 RepID=A0ABU5KLU1_9BACL|nr:flagellar export protein FliJ [Jeotgalibacillus sp. HH7-29]MDZ5711721.1 flagellar export protein FliJ [Jeotgalibacillus sp. HH7-29]
MAYQYRFERVLTVKEREQKEAEDRYRDAVDSFEKMAQKLYELLKKKELMEDSQANQMQTGIPVQLLRHGQQFLTNIEKSISYQQKLVMDARSNMQRHEHRLMERNIEVRKYEKIREHDKKRYVAEQEQADREQMNELSIAQFMNRRSR